MNKIKTLALIIITSITLTACVNDESGKLDNRVKAYWDAKVKKDFKTAYTFLTPGWKKTESEQSYIIRMSGIAINWLSTRIDSKTCAKPDVCKVKVVISFVYRFPTGGGSIESESKTNENWLMIDNVWYILPKKQ